MRPVGRMVLDRNPRNSFPETEQTAFHTADLVPGIDFIRERIDGVAVRRRSPSFGDHDSRGDEFADLVGRQRFPSR